MPTAINLWAFFIYNIQKEMELIPFSIFLKIDAYLTKG